MSLFFLIFIFTEIIATGVSVFYINKLRRHTLTPNGTWEYLLAGFALVLGLQVASFWVLGDIKTHIPPTLPTITFFMMSSVARLLKMYGIIRIYTRIEAKGKILNGK